MYVVLKSDKDTYITDRVIKGSRVSGSNVGGAGSLDLFKLYGYTSSGSTPNVELSRLLVHFDLDPLRDLVNDRTIDPGHASFSCTLKLFDVYGGQPTPAGFTVTVSPLSRSFTEGSGRDVVGYSDRDVCNFLTASQAQGVWLLSGCALGGGLPGTVDYFTASTLVDAGASLTTTQYFTTGEEDLSVDVTRVVSATLAGLIPDQGFRIALAQSLEEDAHSYFVKRFASRTAYDADVRPALIVTFDDSLQDDSTSLELDSRGYIFLHNRRGGVNANLYSASNQVQGSNCIILKMATAISGGWHELYFTGSQHVLGINAVPGIYSASVYVSGTNSVVNSKMIQSGSVDFVPIWGSLDGTLAYLTGSVITLFPPDRGNSATGRKTYSVNVRGIRSDYVDGQDDFIPIRIDIFDATSPRFKAQRKPVVVPGVVIRDVHYQVRDAITNRIVVPFDVENNSTRASSDASGMYARINTTSLVIGRTYVIDVMLLIGAETTVFRDASSRFRFIEQT